ncbi:F-box only protein 15 [Bombina bombina]|uniref:F-box only protein 15 n=1 Tax=Bombina bombina TaxID=8345 RepID=UPI00235B03A6|nr:F-box only protein 15 [Bombina bombina]
MIRSLCWKFKSVDSETELLSNTTLEDKQLGYWKKTYIGHTLTGRQNRLNYVLKSLENCSGVPGTSQIAKAIKLSGLKWTITLRDTKGKEFVFEQMDIFFKENSLSLLWYGTQLHLLASLTTIQLHGVTSAIFDKSMRPMKNGPRTRSLVAEYDLRNLENSVHIGQDGLVNLLSPCPGLLLGIWKASSDLAFVMVTHHYHQLFEKSILGTTDLTFTIPQHVPILDDIDPHYGLHGYQLHIDMHSGPRTYFCETFPGLFCRREYIKNGSLRLSVIGIKNSKQHAPLAGKVGLLWRTDTFECYMKNCFILDITLLDGNKNPFWCISAPVNIRKSRQQDLLFDFMGQNYFLKYEDPLGTIYADLVWMNETEEFYIVYMKLHLNTDKVNSWFGTHY